MKNIFVSLAFAVSILTVSCKNEKTVEAKYAVEVESVAEGTTYNIDTQNSMIEWVGKKPTGQHNGTIKLSGGTLTVNNNMIEGGSATIDMNSITVLDLKPGDGKEDLEGHLKGAVDEKSDDFFNVKKFPEGKFEITAIKADGAKQIVEGNLTLKGVTKNIQFPATVTADGSSASIVSDTFTINRTLWGVNYGSKSIFKDLGDKFVNDEVELKVTVKATK